MGNDGARGAPAIVVNQRCSRYFRQRKVGRGFVAARAEMSPSIVLWIVHAPQHQKLKVWIPACMSSIKLLFHSPSAVVFVQI